MVTEADNHPCFLTNADELCHQLAPLYCRYPTQFSPQDAYIELNPERRTFMASYNPEIGNAIPFSVWHGRSFRIPVSPYLTGKQIADILTDYDILSLAEEVVSGYTCKWNGSNLVGYLSPKAQSALEQLRNIVSGIEGDLAVYSPEDWICPSDAPITAETTDAELLVLSRELIDEAAMDNVLIDGDLYKYLSILRDELKYKSEVYK